MRTLKELAPVQPTFKSVFVVLYVVLCAVLALGLYVNTGSYDYENNRLSKEDYRTRKEKQLRNVCSFPSQSEKAIRCSGLTEQENLALNERLSLDRFSSLPPNERLTAAKTMSDTKILLRTFEEELGGDELTIIALYGALGISAFCLLVGLLVLSISLPVYLFSKNAARAQRAAGLVKSSLRFVIAVGGTVAASFALKR